MQIIQNTILNTTAAAANGPWRNTSNFVASSVEITAQNASTGATVAIPAGTNVWIEASNDPSVMTDNLSTQIAAPTAPTLSQFRPSNSGDQQPFVTPAVTYGVKLIYVNQQGETVASLASSLAVSAGNCLFIAAPGPDPAITSSPDDASYATGYNIYIQIGGSGNYVLQNPPYNAAGSFGNLQPANGPINVNNGFNLYAFNQTGITPPGSNTTGTPNIGANLTGNLNSASPITGQSEISYDNAGVWVSGATKVIMWAPSCLYFNFLRVNVSGSDGSA